MADPSGDRDSDAAKEAERILAGDHPSSRQIRWLSREDQDVYEALRLR